MVTPAFPLFFDVTYMFMQRVFSPYLWDCVREKVAKMESNGITLHSKENPSMETNINFKVIKFHLWALDKGYVICEMNIDVESSSSSSDVMGFDYKDLRLR